MALFSGPDIPEAPNMDKIFSGWKKQTKRGRELTDKHFAWAKRQNRKNWNKTKPVIANLTDMMHDATANSQEDREWYEGIFKPYTEDYMGHIEDQQGRVDSFAAEAQKLKDDALKYGGEENRLFRMGQAQAAVADQMEAARQNNLSMLESYGIPPSATRFAAMDSAVRTAEAAAKAAAGTKAGMDVDETSRAMFQEALDREAQALGLNENVLGARKGVVDLGQNVNKQSMDEAALSGQLGDTAVKSQVLVSDLANKQRMSTKDFLTSTNDSLRGWSEAINTSYANSLKGAEIEAASSSGIGGLAGAALPLIGKLPIFAAEGGEVPGDPQEGIDTQPAMLTPGEFVMPVAAVQKYGTDKLASMRDKALFEAETAMEPAIPDNVASMSPQAVPPLPGHGFSPALFS